jgi:cyanuric acid amidohydrolase
MGSAAFVKVPMAHPADTSGVKAVTERGYDPASVQAVIIKSEGNGCVNDFTRALAARAWGDELPGAVTVVSGGTEGVLSPHATLVLDVPPLLGVADGLGVATAVTPDILPADLGRRAQADAVADAVRAACNQLGAEPDAVEFALVKCPLLTSEQVTDAFRTGIDLVATDTLETMAWSRRAAALGVARALGEIDESQLTEGLAGDLAVFSRVASASSGVELAGCHVVVLARSALAGNHLRAAHTVMADALDSEPLLDLLSRVRADGGRLVQIFAKAEADPSGAVRGWRHTMLTDSDIQSTRHARAAVGGLIAGLTGDPAIYVSGGAEHQGPPGGGTVTAVWELPG